MNADIVVVGSLNADFVIRVPRFPVPGETLTGHEFQVFPGGKGANQAFGAARLGGRVSMVGQVGNDAQGPSLVQSLASGGVNVDHVRTDPEVSTGIATITLDEQGQNQIIIVPGSNGTLSAERLQLSRERIAQAGLVLLQLEIPFAVVQAAARLAHDHGGVVILDPAPAQPLPDALLALVDYLTPNETELGIVTGMPPGPLSENSARPLARRLLSRGAKKVIVKLGAQGALLVTPSQEHFWPAIPVTAVDTTAAGDAFNAAFAVALARGDSEIDAGYYATAAAACSVRKPGAQPSMPADSEVEALLKQAGSRRPA